MKKNLILLTVILSLSTTATFGQLDSMFTLYVSHFDSSGFCFYNPSTLQPGQLLSIYKSYTGDSLNDLVVKTEFTDSALGYHHRRYQQTYKGLRVEFAEFMEHSQNGYLTSSNGKLVGDLDGSADPVASKEEALYVVLSSYPDAEFAWTNDAWEQELQDDLEDEDATYYPVGELLWALDDYSLMPYLIPASRYRLAWRFDVLCLDPSFHKAFYVDASTGDIFREEDLNFHNGPASVFVESGQSYASTQTIDTKWSIGSLKYILRTNDNDREIHTKKYDNKGFAGTNETKDGDDSWDVSDIFETSAHWFASESWDFSVTQTPLTEMVWMAMASWSGCLLNMKWRGPIMQIFGYQITRISLTSDSAETMVGPLISLGMNLPMG